MDWFIITQKNDWDKKLRFLCCPQEFIQKYGTLCLSLINFYTKYVIQTLLTKRVHPD
jgi:hypothetical protein